MITESDIEHIAELADIGISKDEVPEFTTQFNAILDYFEVLDTVEGESAPDAGAVNVFRDDEPRPGLSQEEALANAGSTENGFIKAPRVM
ncbi:MULTISPECIES: Asp-tRNA(Asn)/Glu-tRNA(Gln) amidotransferase subunit GatC [Methanoculleus]|jgi:aspartyl-tRNA(Asn)/glutamyl-tRNA(Gln) amidotransferase subunit C|uniref:Aspartyl/glutamyl-tRNA(Asn/Gln) amidotransferase subunit C n=2 Tax=Methanoculleus TaxID=45989 RepID=A3CTK6_METMJ|nr:MULTISPECIES: Asp-tRNA(Asn)/Glu-tRNA(Gln) amidotransferase subunit GatC [Methanoculleus]ABN56706.1 aspartyl/glutamyl-tRNA(Asn/Gln) amidotransferase subunit C [Methanoculleus marisnigri JR1]MDD4252050.1 Asp-tRNA(Asn)/Glu-tRNA(Gln) amidotransferase subunit GatC [Methanoculleus horonobensis]PKL56979.1 MAG: Asp-tRNA(Asn)/Glu-tRNA(Gln) amidotransferase subunit GatC [Methanomicrobiales archaeon HGW-Methanomicrobiales-6]UYU18141.1 Asp-tRNA(Asn)/Glu-tRNA(Gln) amidotransferase subunit GatC [Methanocu